VRALAMRPREGQDQMAHLVRTSDDLWELPFLFILAFDDGFHYAGVVGAQVHEAVRDACFPDGLEKGEGCCVPASLSVDS